MVHSAQNKNPNYLHSAFYNNVGYITLSRILTLDRAQIDWSFSLKNTHYTIKLQFYHNTIGLSKTNVIILKQNINNHLRIKQQKQVKLKTFCMSK